MSVQVDSKCSLFSSAPLNQHCHEVHSLQMQASAEAVCSTLYFIYRGWVHLDRQGKVGKGRLRQGRLE